MTSDIPPKIVDGPLSQSRLAIGGLGGGHSITTLPTDKAGALSYSPGWPAIRRSPRPKKPCSRRRSKRRRAGHGGRTAGARGHPDRGRAPPARPARWQAGERYTPFGAWQVNMAANRASQALKILPSRLFNSLNLYAPGSLRGTP